MNNCFDHWLCGNSVIWYIRCRFVLKRVFAMPPFTLKLASKKFSMAIKNTQQMPKCHDFNGKTTMFCWGVQRIPRLDEQGEPSPKPPCHGRNGLRAVVICSFSQLCPLSHRTHVWYIWQHMATFTINIPQMWAYIYIYHTWILYGFANSWIGEKDQDFAVW